MLKGKKRIGAEGLYSVSLQASASRGNFRENTLSLTDWNWTEVFALVKLVLIQVGLSVV